jgi:hypothetical protein
MRKNSKGKNSLGTKLTLKLKKKAIFGKKNIIWSEIKKK